LLGLMETPKQAAESHPKAQTTDKDKDEIVAEKLGRYKKLLDEGVITQQEFDDIKKKLLFG